MRKSAFTLIELLIVVAIIAILAAIAVPNFLEAQVRSKVSRIHTELRTVATGLEAYRADNNGYPVDFARAEPPLNTGGAFGYVDDVSWLACLSTPVAYLTSANLVDPFEAATGRMPDSQVLGRWRRAPYGKDSRGYGYVNLPVYRSEQIAAGSNIVMDWPTPPAYVLVSRGPDRVDSASGPGVEWGSELRGWGDADPHQAGAYITGYYDPTNGTVSDGDVVRWGPG